MRELGGRTVAQDGKEMRRSGFARAVFIATQPDVRFR